MTRNQWWPTEAPAAVAVVLRTRYCRPSGKESPCAARSRLRAICATPRSPVPTVVRDMASAVRLVAEYARLAQVCVSLRRLLFEELDLTPYDLAVRERWAAWNATRGVTWARAAQHSTTDDWHGPTMDVLEAAVGVFDDETRLAAERGWIAPDGSSDPNRCAPHWCRAALRRVGAAFDEDAVPRAELTRWWQTPWTLADEFRSPRSWLDVRLRPRLPLSWAAYARDV